jgi:predicted TIM-barrel fold metal-dependent hydrolase
MNDRIRIRKKVLKMIIDSHEHVILPTEKQLGNMDKAGVDKTILFTTTPHPEKAQSLAEFEQEFQVLNTVLSGHFTKEERCRSVKRTIAELCQVLKSHPDRFYGFGMVPFSLTDGETAAWVAENIVSNGLKGIGEISPAGGTVKLLSPIFKAASQYDRLPVWLHTFHPVTRDDIMEIAALCGQFPNVPVIFGHMGGVNWLDVIHLAKEHLNIYLDLSATFTAVAPRFAMEELPERTLFSSDAPYGDPLLSRHMVERLSPSPKVTERVLGGNILELLM